MDSELSANFGLAQTFAQQINGIHPALLERVEISSYSGWISHSRKYIVNRTKCHYVMQDSIRKERFSITAHNPNQTVEVPPSNLWLWGG